MAENLQEDIYNVSIFFFLSFFFSKRLACLLLCTHSLNPNNQHALLEGCGALVLINKNDTGF